MALKPRSSSRNAIGGIYFDSENARAIDMASPTARLNLEPCRGVDLIEELCIDGVEQDEFTVFVIDQQSVDPVRHRKRENTIATLKESVHAIAPNGNHSPQKCQYCMLPVHSTIGRVILEDRFLRVTDTSSWRDHL